MDKLRMVESGETEHKRWRSGGEETGGVRETVGANNVTPRLENRREGENRKNKL